MASGNLETLKRLVENGDGFTLLPALAVDRARGEHPDAALVPFADPVPTRQIYLVRRRVYLKRHLVDTFVRALLDSLPPEARSTWRPGGEGEGEAKRYFSHLDLGGAEEAAPGPS